MPTPDVLNVFVDLDEYSRYEKNKDTITVTVVAEASTPFVADPISVELVKARRARNAVVASADIELTADPARVEELVQFDLEDVVDQDEIHLARFGKYFVRATYPGVAASASVGAGANGVVTVVFNEVGEANNDYDIVVVNPGGTAPLTASVSGTTITVGLAVSGGVPINTENVAWRVANIINQVASVADLVTASYSGDGSTVVPATASTAFTGGLDSKVGESPDFRISLVTVDRLKSDYLFGVRLTATDISQVRFQPVNITGVEVKEVSTSSQLGVYPLTYDYRRVPITNASTTIGAGADGVVTITATDALAGEAGNEVSVVVDAPAGTSALSASYAAGTLTISLAVSGGVPVAGSNRALQIAAVVGALANFSATYSGTGVTDITVESGPTLLTGGVTNTVRTLSWASGPVVPITGAGTYVLRAGSGNNAISKLLCAVSPGAGSSTNYIIVVVKSQALLPTVPAVDELLVEKQKIDDEALRRYIDQACDWAEQVAVQVFLEPTNVVTEPDPMSIQFGPGVVNPVPVFTDADYDFQTNPLTYFLGKNNNEWVSIQTPFYSLLRVDSLFGAIANTRVIDINLSWIEFSEKGGFIQLVPFNQEVSYDFVGLIWQQALRGPTAMPNFWHYNMIVGFRKCPANILEIIAKKAAIDALTALGLALRPGIGSTSISRDGVSESISYTNQQQFGPYTGIINNYKEFVENEVKKIRWTYQGAKMVVV